MVTVLGSNGMLGSVVLRRWKELGAEGDYVVNCIRPDNLLISQHYAETRRLIQPSTDAIDEDTDYAVGKRLLEQLPAVTIRAGLIDITRQPETAYRNWWCNPLTPLEWADLAWELRDSPGVHVAGRETVSRHLVASLVAYLWDRPQPTPAYAEETLSRVQPRDKDRATISDALIEYREWLRS